MAKMEETGPTSAASGSAPPEPGEVPYEDEDLIGGPPPGIGRRSSEIVNGGPVLAHVQTYAQAVCRTQEACVISTYVGHHPDRVQALDILVSSAYGRMPSDFSLGDSVAAFTLREWSSHGIWYVIWKQQINSNDGRGWRQMEDRGSITQNHFDHCHVSFLDRGGNDGHLRIGSSGERVRLVQARLNEFGASLDVDGVFGPATEAAVIEFQARKGLVQDGIVGPQTLAALGL